MNRYALALQLPEIIQDSATALTEDIIQRFNVPSIWLYPPHIPIKYGFDYADEEKLKQVICEFNRTISPIPISIKGVKGDGKLFHLAVEKNNDLKKLQRDLHTALKEKAGITDFREAESSENYEFHFSLAESTVPDDKKTEIANYLKTKSLTFSFPVSKVRIMVKRDGAFVYLEDADGDATEGIMENKKSYYDYYKLLTTPEKPFIIGEIGSNHNGDMEKAKRLIDAAKEAGCDAVKFQSFYYNSLFPQSLLDANKEMVAGGVDALGLEAIQKKLALSKQNHVELKKYADEKGILFFSYPLGKEQVDWLVELDVPFIKIGSPDLPNLPLLKYAAKQGKPMILSVGMGTMTEVEQALETIYAEGNKEVALLHCISVYPSQPEMNNLRNIPMLKEAFGVPVGFSDHSTSTAIPAAAVALGASIIEKHIKLDDGPCRDAAVSLKPDQLKQLVIDVRQVAASLGTSKKVLQEDEKKRRVAVWGRRSILSGKNMKAGDIIQECDLVFKRPGSGISPDKLQYVLGRKLKVNKGPEEPILWGDIE